MGSTDRTAQSATRSRSNLVIIGAGGHGRVCAEIAASSGRFETIAFSDPGLEAGTPIGHWKNTYHDDDLLAADPSPFEIILGVGQTAVATTRYHLFVKFREAGFRFATIVSGTAYVSPDAAVSAGTLVGHGAILNTAATIGQNCIVNTQAVVEHDATIGDHVHVSTGAVVNGECVVGDRSLIGSGAVLRQGVTVCSDVVIGAGAVVVRDIEQPGIYVGIPARKMNDE